MRALLYIAAGMALVNCQQILGIDSGVRATATGGAGGDGGQTAGVGGAGGAGGAGGTGGSGGAVAPTECILGVAESALFEFESPQAITAVAVSPSGNGIVAGWYLYTGPFSSPDNLDDTVDSLPDCFIMQLDASGAIVWTRQLGGAGDCYVTDLHVDDSGDIYVVGRFTSEVAFEGATQLMTANGTGMEGFIVKLNDAGDFMTQQQLFGLNDANIIPTAITDAGEGRVWVGGTLDEQLSINGSTPYLDATKGDADIFLIVFSQDLQSAPVGDVIGSDGPDMLGGLAFVSTGVVAATGTYVGAWPGGPPSENEDAWLAIVDAAGGGATPRWIRTYGSSGPDFGIDVAVHGNVVHMVATANSAVDVGTSMVSAGDAYVLSLGLDQTPVRVSTMAAQGGNAILPSAMAVNAAGEIAVVGWTEGGGFRVGGNMVNGASATRHGFAFVLDSSGGWLFGALVDTDEAAPSGDSEIVAVASAGCRTWLGSHLGVGTRYLTTSDAAGNGAPLMLSTNAISQDVLALRLDP